MSVAPGNQILDLWSQGSCFATELSPGPFAVLEFHQAECPGSRKGSTKLSLSEVEVVERNRQIFAHWAQKIYK